jgi:putative nucleotidyltransferase with HDIG domain
MDEQKIQQIEDEIKELAIKSGKEEFWNYHNKPVIDCAKQLAEKYHGDLEISWLGAILHDIARFDDSDSHDVIGAERGYDFLLKKGFSPELAEKVRATILTHRCKDKRPENLEQKIVASADALAHFTEPFYLWVATITEKKFADFMVNNFDKIERDYNEKIFFEDEKKMVKKEYEVLKKWFTGKE